MTVSKSEARNVECAVSAMEGMVETVWPQLEGDTLQYRKQQWELTGAVDIRDVGSLIALESKQINDVRQPIANLRFGSGDDTPSVNPGDLLDMFRGIQREGNTHYLILKSDRRRYRYELLGIERR